MSLENVLREFVREGRIAEIKHVVSEAELLLNGLEQPIRVKVHRYAVAGEMPYFYNTSHLVQTPLQERPLFTDDPWAESETAAARLAIDGIVGSIEEAISHGLKPTDAWLIKDEFWR
jgi:hypothetical protein